MAGSRLPFRKKTPEDSGEWALTFADMMTLLLTFFVLMLAVAKVDKNRFRTVAESLSDALKGQYTQQDRALGEVRQQIRAVSLFQLERELSAKLKSEKEAVTLKLRPDAVAVELSGNYFFDTASADLTPQSTKILTEIAASVANTGYHLVVEGHTDNLPIATPKYPSNWELSSARASAVARFLIANGVPRQDLMVTGLADTQPKAPNTTPENRALNRRVVILVKPAGA